MRYLFLFFVIIFYLSCSDKKTKTLDINYVYLIDSNYKVDSLSDNRSAFEKALLDKGPMRSTVNTKGKKIYLPDGVFPIGILYNKPHPEYFYHSNLDSCY